MRWLSALATVVILLLPVAVRAQQPAAPDPLWGVGFDEALASPGGLAAVLARPIAGTWVHPIHIRLIVSRAELEPAPGRFEFGALDARLDQYRRLAGVDVYIDIRGEVPAAAGTESWNTFLRALAGHGGPMVRGYVVGHDWRPRDADAAPALAFFVKDTAVTLRAQRADVTLTLGGIGGRADLGWLDAFYAADAAPYLDAIALEDDASFVWAEPIVDRRDPTSAMVIAGASLGDAPAAAAERFTETQSMSLGTRVTGVTYAAAPAVAEAALPAIAYLRDLIDQPMSQLDPAAAQVKVTGGWRGRPEFGLTSGATYFIYVSDGKPVDLSIIDSAGTRPTVRDAVRQARVEVEGFSYDAPSRRETMRLPGATYALIVDWSTGDTQTRVERTGASTSVLPSVAEIIARHQQAQAAQDLVIASWIADATITVHFRPTPADPGWDVVTTDRYYTRGRDQEFEELTFRINGTSWGPDHPPFPLLQPEKVLSLPLDLRLTADYRYALDGTDTLDGRECFVVRFDPAQPDASLFRGTVWIDRATWLTLKMTTVQTNLAAPIMSSEETQRFARVGVVNGRDVYMLTEAIVRQNLLMAGRSVPLERHVELRDFQLNPADFETRRQDARASNHVMFRETDKGLRHFILKDGQRVVDDGITTSIKAFLIGANFDPSFDYPLPLGGLNYINFQLLGHQDTQLAMIFAGVLALINVQRPHLLGDRVDGSLDLFAIAVPSSDRTYTQTGELEGERVNAIPFNTGVNLGWRVTERVRLTGLYEFHYDWYFHDTTTAPTFVLPTSTATNGAGMGIEWKRGGYAVAANWSFHARAHWEPWGSGTDFDPSTQQYTRDSVSLTKDILRGIHKFHLNAAYYGGSHLDRFSQYQFGFFDEHKIHGVPSSGVRFSELGMFRATYGLNLFEQYRLELSLDHAYGRDPFISPDWQRITGIGVGFLLRGPHQTMIRGDIGKSFLPARYAKPGSLVFQIQILKPL